MPHDAIEYINHYGYAAIFVLVFLQEIGVPNPVPNELVLMFSGYLTSTGALSLLAVLITAIVADALGATILYITFYFFGGYILSHKPKWLPLPMAKIDRLSVKVSSGGGLISIFLGRITPFIRGYISVISGLLKIKPGKYLPLILITAIMVSGAYIMAGRLLGPYWTGVAGNLSKIKYIALAIALLIAIYIVIANLNKKRKNELTFNANSLNGYHHPLTIHMVSETEYVTKGQGVHTAFLELIELLREKNDVKVIINNEGRGDVFHSHTYGPYYFWKGRGYKGRRIHTVHVIPDSIKGSLPMWKYLLPVAKAYFKMAFSYADVLIALSPMVEDAIRDLDVKTPIVKIYNPVLLEHWKRTPKNRERGRQLLGVSEHDIVVLGVGQLQERKGVEDFVDIGEAIPNAKFVWVGGRPFGIFTEGINRINEKIVKAPANIQFAGMFDLSNMPAIYAAADVFLFPSYQENCPLAPLEAAACGLPVIYRDIKEYALLYDDYYLNAGNTSEFITLTKRLIDDAAFYAEAEKISDKLVQQFDKNIIRAKLIDLYTRVFNEANMKSN